jgi:hypothetical protein
MANINRQSTAAAGAWFRVSAHLVMRLLSLAGQG